MRVIEAHEIGCDAALTPLADVGTISVTIVGPARRPQKTIEGSTSPQTQVHPAEGGSGRQDAPEGHQSDTAARRSRTIIVY